ncbi:MAG: hypothetical protein ACEPO8_11720 [Rhodothermaceae bacterium]
MTKLLSVLLILIVSFTHAQSDTLTSKIDTANVSEVNSNTNKVSNEFEVMSLTYLKMSSPLNDFNLNSNALYYSQTFVLPGQFNAPNNLPVVADFLSPLRPRIDPTKQTVQTILKYVGTAAAFGVAAVHVKKYWKEYKRDLGFK